VQTTIFNQPTNYNNYKLWGLIFSYVGLSNKFGYISFWYLGDYQSERDAWQLKGCIISDTLYGEIVDVQTGKEIPEEMELYQNYPNPFNPNTIIKYTLVSRQFVTIKIFDILGNEITTLVNEEKESGEYKVEFSSTSLMNSESGIRHLAAGIYFYQLKAGKFIGTKKMVVMK